MKITMSGINNKLDKLARAICYTRGYCQCGQHCGKGFKVLQWAHIWGRDSQTTRWLEENCFLLCKGCHSYFHHKPNEFALFVISKIGEDSYWALCRLSHQNSTMTLDDKIQLAVKLTLRLAELQKGR